MFNKITNNRFGHLAFSLFIFTILFVIFFYTRETLENSYPAFFVFLGATFLTLSAIYIIYGFSKLNLDRTAYLLLGFIGVICAYFAAQPMVKRAETMRKNAGICAQTLKITASIASTGAEQVDLNAIKFRNELYSSVSEFIGENIKEPVLFIFLLALSQLLLASGIGLWIGNGIDKISHLIPVALVAAIADIWSVAAGATSAIVVSPIMNYFFLRFPVFGSSSIPYLIGLTDYLFFGIFFQASVRYNLGVIKNTFLLALSFLVTVAFALFYGLGLPVLPFMGLFFVLGNLKLLKIDKEDKKEILLFMLAIGLVFTLITFFMK